MKKLNILFIAVGMIVITKSTFCQSSILGNNGTVNTQFLGWNTATFPLAIRHNGTFPINFLTTNVFRMKINPNITYQVNQLPTQNRNGYVLIGNDGFSAQSNRTLAANNWGAFSAALASIAKRNLRV